MDRSCAWVFLTVSLNSDVLSQDNLSGSFWLKNFFLHYFASLKYNESNKKWRVSKIRQLLQNIHLLIKQIKNIYFFMQLDEQF